jgi:hypothetical protein
MILNDLLSCTGCTGLTLTCISLRIFANVLAMFVLADGTYLNDGSRIDFILNKKECKELTLEQQLRLDV